MDAVQSILEEYDFIGISEWLHESLVVLEMILNLTISDILYAKSAKVAGGFDDGMYANTCFFIQPIVMSR